MRTDVIVVGAGLMGSAAAWSLSRRDRAVVVVEAFEPGHQRGSSHGSARLFRRAYTDPLYVGMTAQTIDLWQRLSDEAGEELLQLTGAIDFGPGLEAEKMYELLTTQRVAADLLTAAQAAERWPGLNYGDGPVLFHAEAGVFDPERAMAAMLRLAVARGAQVRFSTPATSIEPDGTVRTADESYTAPVVIVAAGAWLGPLLGQRVKLPPLNVTQTEAFYFGPGELAPAWPPFLYHDQVPLYGLPAGGHSEAADTVKMGVNGPGTRTTADGRDGVVNAQARERVRKFVHSNVPALDKEPQRETSCLYTSTVNNDFIMDRQGAFVVCSACSRHGGKFAPLIGEIVADLACGKATPQARFTLAAHLEAAR